MCIALLEITIIIITKNNWILVFQIPCFILFFFFVSAKMNDGSERATIPHLHLSFSKAAYVRLDVLYRSEWKILWFSLHAIKRLDFYHNFSLTIVIRLRVSLYFWRALKLMWVYYYELSTTIFYIISMFVRFCFRI